MELLGVVVKVVFLCLVLCHSDSDAASTQGECQCGWSASCVNATCVCPSGHELHPNGRDCRNATCADSGCLKCSEASVCVRCVNFILANDASCVDRCSGEAEVRNDGPLQGNVCIQTESSDDTKLIIGVAAGVGAGVVLCLIIILIVCIYIRRTRKNVSLQHQQYKAPRMEVGNIKQFPVYDNQAFVGEGNGDLKSGVVDPAVYAMQLEQLRPHTETLMALLAQIRPKLRAMEPGDPRIPTYKGVIHQLCRVLVLLHRKDTGTSIPSDALGLIEWAQQMLEDHRQQQELQPDVISPDVLGDLGQTRISYIDVDMDPDRLHSPVYADPQESTNQSLQSGSGVTPYSSVPVPMPPTSTEPRRTFATIHRTPSVPSAVNNKGGYTRPTGQPTNSMNRAKRKDMGYFANGRYYDPNPMPQPEIYAPASSYSDRSTAPLSTFIPDQPRSRSLSTSECSTDGEENVDGDLDREASDGDLDLFPFDPKDATEPVEV